MSKNYRVFSSYMRIHRERGSALWIKIEERLRKNSYTSASVKIVYVRKHFGTTPSTVITLTRYYFHDLSSAGGRILRARKKRREKEFSLIPFIPTRPFVWRWHIVHAATDWRLAIGRRRSAVPHDTQFPIGGRDLPRHQTPLISSTFYRADGSTSYPSCDKTREKN